jgi:hypothetical protein
MGVPFFLQSGKLNCDPEPNERVQATYPSNNFMSLVIVRSSSNTSALDVLFRMRLKSIV